MSWMVENWFLIVTLIAVVGMLIYAVYIFCGLPTEKQRRKVMEWLVWACVEAEKELQSGTGQLKLREVWNKFCGVRVFSLIAKFISFETFSDWVSDALTNAKEMLVKNKNLAEYVYGANADREIQKLNMQLINHGTQEGK